MAGNRLKTFYGFQVDVKLLFKTVKRADVLGNYHNNFDDFEVALAEK